MAPKPEEHPGYRPYYPCYSPVELQLQIGRWRPPLTSKSVQFFYLSFAFVTYPPPAKYSSPYHPPNNDVLYTQ